MNKVECFITPHIGDKLHQCDDHFAVNLKELRFAIADGSSSDFFSKIYSRLLVDNFVKYGEQILSDSEIGRINDDWKDEVLKKLTSANCKPGSFPYVRFQKRDPGCSTLIGLQLYLDENNEPCFKCFGLGDSVLFFIPADKLIPTLQFSSDSNEKFEFSQEVIFGYTPTIASSYSSKWLENIRNYSGYLEKGTFVLMTDGTAEWFLRKCNHDSISQRIERIMSIHSEDDFISFIDDIRKHEDAKNDDMTLVKIYIDDLSSIDFDFKSSHIYHYRDVAKEDEFKAKIRSEIEVDVKKRLESQNAFKLSAERALLEKKIKKELEAEYEKKIQEIKKSHEGDLERTRSSLDTEIANALDSATKKWDKERDDIYKKGERDGFEKAQQTLNSSVADLVDKEVSKRINDAKEEWDKQCDEEIRLAIEKAREEWEKEKQHHSNVIHSQLNSNHTKRKLKKKIISIIRNNPKLLRAITIGGFVIFSVIITIIITKYHK